MRRYSAWCVSAPGVFRCKEGCGGFQLPEQSNGVSSAMVDKLLAQGTCQALPVGHPDCGCQNPVIAAEVKKFDIRGSHLSRRRSRIGRGRGELELRSRARAPSGNAIYPAHACHTVHCPESHRGGRGNH